MQKSLKKYTITGIVIVSLLGTLAHFFYQWSGENPAAALFSPVNESTWEHLKLLFFPMVFYSAAEALIFQNRIQDLFWANMAGTFAGLLAIPVLFYTYSGILGRK